jgi:hypothetical protein
MRLRNERSLDGHLTMMELRIWIYLQSNRGINEQQYRTLENAVAIGNAFVLSGLITCSYPLLLQYYA